MKQLLLASAVCMLSLNFAYSQQFIPLWPEGNLPNSKGLHLTDSIANERVYQVGTPGMYAFFTGKQENKGSAVVICPGGGYERLAYIVSGTQLAKWFNTFGVNAFVLNYRLPVFRDLVNRTTGPLQDAQRALKVIRSHAAEWGIAPDRIGVQGSSAGGHLAAWVSNSTEDVSNIGDSTDHYAFTPNFTILVSPVIDMGQYAHAGSKKNLLGPNPSEEDIHRLSVQNLVTDHTPPAFIVDAFNDNVVPPMNSLLYYQALLTHHVASSFHVFPQGAHAIALRNNPGSAGWWTTLCESWMQEMRLLPDIK